MMAALPRTLAWFLPAALLWAGVDLLQVAISTGGHPLGALALVVLALYVTTGALAALASAPLFSGDVGLRTGWPGAVFASALILPGAALAAAYVNFVHLPNFFTPVTLATNLAITVAAVASLLSLARSATAGRLGNSRSARIVVAALGVILSAIAARGWVGSTPAGAIVSADDRPNVFVVVIDSLRADRVRPTGPSGLERTPALAALATRGVTFDRAYAQASWTKPSVASLLTSLFPSTHGANLRGDRLSPEATPLAEVFARNGYRTAVFSANPWVSPAFGFDRGVDHFFETEQETFGRMVLLMRVLRALDRPLPSKPFSRAIAQLERAAGLGVGRRNNCERDRAILSAFGSWLADPTSRPAFAYVHLMSPHIPYEPPSGTRGFASTEQVGLLMRTEPLDASRRTELIELYDETVTHADSVLSEILDVIDARGLRERSIVVVTADHGEEFFEHGRFGHGKTLHDEVVHIPLVIAGPGLPAGVTRRDPAMLVDVAPTVAALAGIVRDPQWRGRDLREDRGDVPAYAELLREGGLEVYMACDGNRKYIETTSQLGASVHAELFDLKADPTESRALSPSAGEALRGELVRLRDAARSTALARAATAIDASAEERLRSLGYIN